VKIRQAGDAHNELKLSCHQAAELIAAGGKVRTEDVLIIPASYRSLEEAVAEVFRTFPLDPAGKKVLLKPNMVGAYPPSGPSPPTPVLSAPAALTWKKRGRGSRWATTPG